MSIKLKAPLGVLFIFRQNQIFDYTDRQFISNRYFLMIVWRSREEVNTAWTDSRRERYKTKKRDYILGSFFSTVITAIIDPKDWKAIKIKTDPAYLHDSNYRSRVEAD